MPKSALSYSATATGRGVGLTLDQFAPGHLGALTAIVPVELVDAVLEETRRVERRLRLLPSRVGVYFLLAMCLFPEVGYRLVWDKLTAGLGGLPVQVSTKALRDLRRRVGVAPIRALFEVLAGPVAQPATPGVRFANRRTVSFDGCSSQKVPDTDRNRRWLGWSTRVSYPMLEVMTLVETGTRALIGAVVGATTEGETSYAARLLHLLDPSMLVLWDRGFDSGAFLAQVAATGAQFLGRVRNSRRPPVHLQLDDGSYLSVIGTVKVRIVEACITVTCADGTAYNGLYRLATSLTDHRRHPATALVRLYHERWEHESAYYALRHTLLDGRVLRSGDPYGVEQEVWSWLTLYQVLRIAMVDAAESRPGTDPDRLSFHLAHQSARDHLIRATDIADPVGIVGHTLLDAILPPRRRRVSTRKVKSPTSRYAPRQPDGRPFTSQNITSMDITVSPPQTSTTLAESARVESRARRRAATPPRPIGGRREEVLTLLQTDPTRHWRGRDIAQALGVTNIDSLCTQLTRWSRRGYLHKTAPATYTLDSAGGSP